MRPIEAWPQQARLEVRAVLSDIDDTMTTDGHLSAAAYAAMERLQEAGILVVPVTGRPAGWCDMIARFWPVDAVVGENGAFYFRYRHDRRRMERRYVDDAATRAANRERLAALGTAILAAVPGAAVAADQPYRESDLAIDFCEDVPPLRPEAVKEIVHRFEAAGASAKVSSIHVNGWFGRYDKLGMARTLMRDAFGIDLSASTDACAYIGDSPNDAPMFGFFKHSIGVANVRGFAGRLDPTPTYVTTRSCGDGFVEFVEILLAAR